MLAIYPHLMFIKSTMFYGLEQLDCFQMPTLRFQHCVFLHRTFHKFVTFLYTTVTTQFSFVYMCILIVLIILKHCSADVSVEVYIFCLCSCVMKNACLKFPPNINYFVAFYT